MIDAARLTQVSELFAQAKTIFVMVPSLISADQRAAAEALVSSLSQADKAVQFFSPDEIHHESFPESEEVVALHELGNQNLCVSFDYLPERVDNVSYHIGEKTGRLDDVLAKVSDFYSRETENIVSNLTSLIEPFIMVLIGVAVGGMVAAIILPMYNLANQF